MAGAIAIVVILVIVLPVLLMITGAIVAVILGSTLRRNGEATHEGSELLDLNT